MAILNSLRQVPALAAALAAVAAHGALTNTARVIISPDYSGGGGPVDIIHQNPGVVDATGASTGGFNSSGNATSHVEYGYISLRAHAVVSLNAGAIGTFQDSLTFHAPGVTPGTIGTVTYSFRVDGSMSAPQGSSGSTWSAAVDLGGGATDLSKTGHIYSPEISPLGYQGDPYGTYFATTTFQFGFAATLYVNLQVTADAANTQSASGLADIPYAHLYWNGITSVKINGVPVNGVTVTSSSGTSWGFPIAPCPGDLNGDDQVDDSDFVVFVVAYNILDCADPSMPAGCPADLNSDGFVDDSDFVMFVSAYDALVCP